MEVTAASSDRTSSIQGPSPTSPISCAPVQVLLRDKVLWPANSKGFSMSIWLRLEGLPDAEDGFLCRRNRKQVRTKTFGKTSHSDNSTSMYVLKLLRSLRLADVLLYKSLTMLSTISNFTVPKNCCRSKSNAAHQTENGLEKESSQQTLVAAMLPHCECWKCSRTIPVVGRSKYCVSSYQV